MNKYEVDKENPNDYNEDIKALSDAMEEDDYKLAKKLIMHLRCFHHLNKEYVKAKLRMLKMMKELREVQKERMGV
ncbi:MAG: hypothetical protein K6T73_03435 [Candidatus Bathyarchaeota archaeon]|nr:hypothetical protein [Candidatus Bathyarchaeota archaeon]